VSCGLRVASWAFGRATRNSQLATHGLDFMCKAPVTDNRYDAGRVPFLQSLTRLRRYVAGMKITPVLIVPSIEPVLPLWEALGFTRTAEVPHGGRLGFVILACESAEIMYQTLDSVRADEPKALDGPAAPRASLFIEVPNLDDVVAKLPAGTDVVVERRTTPYGATETFIRDAAGNVVVFAQFAK